jgi:hypothetical protein
MSPQSHPELPTFPELAFRVGVIGHRPNRLQQADLATLSKVINEILRAVKIEMDIFHQNNSLLFGDQPLPCWAITSLAEGTDRLFAEQALDLSFGLVCPFPFPKSEFEKDFTSGNALEPDSLRRFQGLLEQAEKVGGLTIIELDGRRSEETAAYSSAGRFILDHSKLLLAVWDGRQQGKSGGTEETLVEALRQGIPVIWVEASNPQRWRFLDGKSALPQGKDGQTSTINEFDASTPVIVQKVVETLVGQITDNA